MIAKKTVSAIELCVRLASLRGTCYQSTRDLSESLGLSISHIETLLKVLKINNIVDSSRGPGGGYLIKKDPSCISIWDIASLFEETLSKSEASIHESTHVSFELELEQVVINTLSQLTLADFAAVSIKHQNSDAFAIGQFKFKPLELPFTPKAPNSVFQLGLMA
jgi:Rrf2 family iron-sulfur cluster assembly transcriptional regulator